MAQVMGVDVKSKQKITHTDPYSGGNTSLLSALVPSVSTPALLPHHVTFISTSMTTTANSYYFDEATIDLCNTVLLQSLLCAQLNRLCKYYGVKAKGTNEDIIHALSAIIYPPPLCPTL
ncbi:hypothetical protein L208DRAFT_1327722 [Tricholoma matsutake]|nr:hypothetical protein L208DRAFT_1327722 [Tricholoma matsutake 945]